MPGSNELKVAVCGGHQSDYLQRKQEERFARLAQFENEFSKLFRRPLHFYCNRSTGFDSRRLWASVFGKLPEGTSYDNATRDRYGARAVELIHDLIDTIAD